MLAFPNLHGFDMVYALTQQTINHQFKLLWALGIFPSSWKASIKNDLYSIDATLGTPSISFNTGDSSARKVNLILPLTQGTFHYATVDIDPNGNPIVKREQADISGSTLRLTANLSLAEIAATYKNAANVPAEVKAQLSKFRDDFFSIQHLFMNLEDANLLDTFQLDTHGRVDMTQPEVVGHLRDLVQAYVNGLKGSSNPYILGYSVTDKKSEGSDATWKPTGLTFSTYSDTAHPLRSSLNYLLETRNKRVPGGGAGLFTENWVRRDNVQGTFAFSPELVLNDVLEALTRVLPVKKSDFSATGGNHYTATFPNDIDGKTTVTVSPAANTNTLPISIHATFRKNMHDKAGSKIGYVDGYIDWTSTLTFTVDSKNHTVKVGVTNSVPQTHKEDHPNALGKFEHALAVFADFIVNIVTFGQVHNAFQNLIKDDWSSTISTHLGVAVQAVRARIVLPAGSQLFFKDCAFLQDGTMLLTTTIQN